MASVSVFDLTRFTALAAGDVIPAVDISNTTQNAHGSLLSITVTNFFGGIPVPLVVTAASGVRFGATAALAGITGLFATHNIVNTTPDVATNVARGSVNLVAGYGATPYFAGARSDGTVTAPTAVSNGNLVVMQGIGYDGTNWAIGGEVQVQASETWSAIAHGTSIVLQTIPAASTSLANTIGFSLSGTTSRIVPAATAIALRNNANNADNLLVTDAGAGTFRTSATATTFVAFGTNAISTTALATPSALSATQFTGFASTVSGAVLMGFGTTHDVALKNRAGTTVIGVGPNTTAVTMAGTLAITGALSGVTTLVMSAGLSGVTTIAMNGALTGATSGSFSGTITSTQAGAALFSSTGATTNYKNFDIRNTGAILFFGIDSSAGGSLLPGSTAYATVIASVSNTPVEIGSNNALVARFDSSATATHTRFLIYDVDSAALQRVLVGANNSGPGGSGRALYVANS